MTVSAQRLRSALPALAGFTGLIGLACLACSGDREVAPAAVSAPPNIVLITLDTLRPDHTGPYGYGAPTTPFLDGLAERATVFGRAFSTSSWTAPSTASIFTGLYPNEHGVIAGFRAHAKLEENVAEEGVELPGSKTTVHERMQLVQLPGSRKTLVEHLAGAGYATFGIATNLNIGSELGFDRGYEEFERMYLSPAAEVAAQVLDWRERLQSSGHYFLYLHLNDAHMPYEGRVEFGYEEVMEDGRTALADDVARYDSEIRYLDHWLGQLYREMGWSEGTVLMIVSDHGEEFRDHGRTGHRYSLYRELNDVLMMLAGPAISAARVVNSNVSLIDVLPTLLEAAGVAPPDDLPGHSLLGLARGAADSLKAERPLFAHRIRGGATEPLLERPPLWAVIAGKWKLIDNGEDDTLELYDVLADPAETRDLAAAQPAIVAELRALLEAFATRSIRHEGTDVEIEVDDELLRTLEALGYAGHD